MSSFNTTLNPSATSICASHVSEIRAYVDKTPGGRHRFISYNPFKAKPRKSEGITCGTWIEPDSPEHRAAVQRMRKRLDKMQAEYFGAKINGPIVEDEKPKITFIDFLTQRADVGSLINRGRRLRAIAYTKSALPSTVQLSELEYLHWDSLRKHLLANVSPETARNYLGWIKGQLSEAARQRKLIDANPWAGLNVSVGNYHHAPHKKQRLTVNELSKLKQARTSKPDILRAFLFACATATGRADIERLTRANIRRNADGSGRLTYTRSKTRGQKPMTATVKLSAQTLGHIGPEQSGNEPLFPPLPSVLTVNKELRRMAASVGLHRTDLSFYCGRHTFICLHLEAKTPLYALRAMTGHASINALMRYALSLNLEDDQYALEF